MLYIYIYIYIKVMYHNFCHNFDVVDYLTMSGERNLVDSYEINRQPITIYHVRVVVEVVV